MPNSPARPGLVGALRHGPARRIKVLVDTIAQVIEGGDDRYTADNGDQRILDRRRAEFIGPELLQSDVHVGIPTRFMLRLAAGKRLPIRVAMTLDRKR